ncbi:MAG TPA: hypothetical protein VGE77_08115 [Nocardioides sp.]
MPFLLAAVLVGLVVGCVAAIAFGLRAAITAGPGRRRLVALGLSALGLAGLVAVEVVPRMVAGGLPADDPCLPDAVEISVDATPVALQVLGGGVRGEASLSAAGLQEVVTEQLAGTVFNDADVAVRLGDGEVLLELTYVAFGISVPLEATVEPGLEGGELALHPTAVAVVGIDAPERAVGLADDELQRALASGDGSCGGSGGATVELTALVVDDRVRVRFRVPVS